MKLFIYGALKTGQMYNNQLVDSTLIRTVKTSSNYMLYQPHRTIWPCLAPLDGGVSVNGELWEVTDDTISSLDKFHCSPKIFQLKSITLDNEEVVSSYLIADNLMDKKDLAKPIGDDWPVKDS